MKRFKKIAIWLGLIAYLILISGFISGKRNAILCNKVNVAIADSSTKRFLEQRDIIEILGQKNLLSLGINLTEINTNKIESLILANSIVKKCNVYTTVDGVLNIELWQREPVVRIIDKKGQNYYLDVEGSVISMSRRFTPHLLVVNGNISTPFNTNVVENIYDPKYKDKTKTLRDIHNFAIYVRNDKFWNSQIVQLYVDSKKEFEIVPRVGPHLIQMGSIEDYEKKLKKLKLFYKEGLNKVGWNQYLKINLKYKDQIVCSKI